MKGKSAFVLTVKIYWPQCNHMFPLMLCGRHSTRVKCAQETDKTTIRWQWKHGDDDDGCIERVNNSIASATIVEHAVHAAQCAAGVPFHSNSV